MNVEDGEHSLSDGNGVQSEAEVLEGICRVVNMMDNVASNHSSLQEVYVKSENMEDEEEENLELMEGEEVVLEELATLPSDDVNDSITLPDSYIENKIRYKVVRGETSGRRGGENEGRQQKIDKDDPRSRLHYIKYLKREGKPMKTWECGICGKEFRHQYTLMRHLPTHTDERNYKCADCGKAFRQMSTLSQHRAIHSDARPYVCECCKKTFNRVSTLISHRKTHSELKPHKCPMCFKGFHQKGNLRNHVFTHTNERPYKCDICEKGFNQMSNLVCHKAHVHGDKSRHVCSICGNEFLRRYALRLHEEYKHGIQYRAGVRTQISKDFDPNSVQLRQKRKDEGLTNSKKNLKIIHLPNGDRTLANISSDVNVIKSATATQRLSQPSSVFAGENKVTPSGVIIDPIETKAMRNAKDAGQTPFALLKPAKGIPVLVKVMAAPNNKQMLLPATVEDLKSAGKITVSPNYDSTNNGNPIKAVQIKVPVVATVIQRVGPNGQLTISVESPGPDQAQEAAADATVSGTPSLNEMVLKEEAQEQEEHDCNDPEEEVVEYLQEDGTTASMEEVMEPEVQYLQDDGTLVSEPRIILREDGTIISGDELEELAHQQVEEYTVLEDGADGMVTPGLLELASTGEIQLVRPSEDGAYEVLSQEEAANLIQHQGQTIEILGQNPDIQFQEMLEEGEDGEVLVNQNNLSALVSAIRSAGYQVLETEGEQILEEDAEDVKPPQLISAEGGDVDMTLDQNATVSFVMDDDI